MPSSVLLSGNDRGHNYDNSGIENVDIANEEVEPHSKSRIIL